MKLLQINTTVNSGSTGRIAEEIGKVAISGGFQSTIAYGRGNSTSNSELIRIGSQFDIIKHGLKSYLFDLHGFGSKASTYEFVNDMTALNPDIIHLHNIHGYFLNIEILFKGLKEINKPVIWTLHDCWPFTGHCSYFDAVNCFKWQVSCFACPNLKGYPASIGIDNSFSNFNSKKRLFTSLNQLHIVTPSEWLKRNVQLSFLRDSEIHVIPNGVDLEVYSPEIDDSVLKRYNLLGKKYILGVASTWDKRKGLNDFIDLSYRLSNDLGIVLVGLNKKQLKQIPEAIVGIPRTENSKELATLYAGAQVFVNPTYVDNFPTTNIESLACGTPVVTYETGGSPEAIDFQTGIVVKKGNKDALLMAVQTLIDGGKSAYTKACRERAERLFDKSKRFQDYLELYQKMLM